MKKYTWVWKDDSATHTNTTNRLEEIIDEIVSYYYDSEITGFELTIEDGQYVLFFEVSFDDAYQYVFGTTPSAVAEFLDQLAEQCNRQDSFEIYENQ